MTASEQAVTVVDRGSPEPPGATRALVVGVALVALWVAAFFMGPALIVVAGVGTVAAVVAAWRHTGGRAAAKWVLVASAAVWLVCTAVFWWLWGVAFDATDAMRPVPGYADTFDGPALALGTIAFVVFWGTLAWVVVRSVRTPAGR